MLETSEIVSHLFHLVNPYTSVTPVPKNSHRGIISEVQNEILEILLTSIWDEIFIKDRNADIPESAEEPVIQLKLMRKQHWNFIQYAILFLLRLP